MSPRNSRADHRRPPARTLLFLAAVCLFLPTSIVPAAEARRPATNAVPDRLDLRDGDLIFHTSRSRQSAAVRIATGSNLTHCGIVHRSDGKWFVLEAVQPVKLTPLEAWIARGEKGRFAVRRILDRERLLTPAVVARMKQEGKRLLGRNYDLTFEWSDERIYCSELIWKIYRRGAGLEIGTLQKLRDFRIADPRLKRILQERYGDRIPLDEKVISPQAVYDSPLLETVYSNL